MLIKVDVAAPRLRVQEWRGLLGLKVASLCFLAGLVFLLSAGQFLSGHHNLDRFLLHGLPTPFDSVQPTSARVTHLAHTLSALGSPEVVAIVAVTVVGFLALAGQSRASFFVLCSVAGGAAFAYGLKSGFGLLRPHHPPGDGLAMLNTSFPSGHTMLAAILYFTTASLVSHFVEKPKRRMLTAYAFAAATALTAAVAASRIVLAVHWPSDVLAGVVAGAAWVALASGVARGPRSPRANCTSGRPPKDVAPLADSGQPVRKQAT